MRVCVILFAVLFAGIAVADENICINSAGNFTAPLCDSAGALKVNGGSGATSFTKAEDAPHTTGDTGVFALGVSDQYGGDTRCGDEDYCPIKTTLGGSIFTVIDGNAQPQEASGILKTEDNASSNGSRGVGVLSVRCDVGGTVGCIAGAT